MSPTEEPGYSSVDCTLSLGPPSARGQRSSVCASAQRSSVCWGIMAAQSKTHHLSAGAVSSSLGGSDPLLLARRCANCDTTSTPLWRNGPRGPKSLCNACGIRYKKEERRAAGSTASPAESNFRVDAAAYQRQQQQQYQDMEQMPSYLSWRLNAVPPHQPSLGLYQYQ